MVLQKKTYTDFNDEVTVVNPTIKVLGWLNIHPGFIIENQLKKHYENTKHMQQIPCDTLQMKMPTIQKHTHTIEYRTQETVNKATTFPELFCPALL